MSDVVGSAGLGLVWGWLAGSLVGRVRRPRRTLPLVGLLLVLLFGQAVWLNGASSAASLVSGCVIGCAVHAAWRAVLIRRV